MYVDEKKRKLEHELLEEAKVRYQPHHHCYQEFIIITVARQLEIEAEEEAKNYVELHYLAMLLGLPSSMVDQEVASLKTEKETRNANVSFLMAHYLPFICSTIYSW